MSESEASGLISRTLYSLSFSDFGGMAVVYNCGGMERIEREELEK